MINVATKLYMGDGTDIFKGESNIGQMEVSNYTLRMYWITSTICYDSKYYYKSYTGKYTGEEMTFYIPTLFFADDCWM